MPAADADSERLSELIRHQQALRACRACPGMTGPPVAGRPVLSPVMLMGQAPGAREIEVGMPFAWTAGKTLFRWLGSIGLSEREVRDLVYMTAVCRCFPGKNPRGGDRVPDREEVRICERWWRAELALVRPRLIIPVGRLAIARFLGSKRLEDVVGACWEHEPERGESADVIPLPHPSGASVWFKTEPGKTLLGRALDLIADHVAWKGLKVRG